MQTENVAANNTTQQPVLVKKVVKVRRKRSLTSLLLATVFLLTLVIIIGGIFSTAIWLHTYRVFTQEKVVADLHVSKKVIKDGKPTFTVKYIPYDDVSGLGAVWNSKSPSDDKEVDFDMVGDQIFINADFVKWNDKVTFLGVKPMYKVNRILPGFQEASDYSKYGVTVKDLNGGPDAFAKKLQENPGKYKWLAESVFISSAGVNVQNEDRNYKVIITEDALILARE